MAKEVDSNTKWLSMVLGTLAIAAIAALLLYSGWFVVQNFGKLNPEVAVAIVSAFGALLIALAGRSLERRTQAIREQQQRRIPVYEEFVKGIFKGMQLGVPKDNRKEDFDAEQFLATATNFTQKVLVWGSPEVLQAWVEFRYEGSREGVAKDEYGQNLLLLMEEFFMAMRKDLGLSNRGVSDGDLLKLFINDLDDDKIKQIRRRMKS